VQIAPRFKNYYPMCTNVQWLQELILVKDLGGGGGPRGIHLKQDLSDHAGAGFKHGEQQQTLSRRA